MENIPSIESNINPLKKREEKIKKWLKDKYNLLFLAVLAFAFIIRLYYFYQTINQPIWWDESDYLAYAKNLAGLPANWIITTQHNSLYPYLAAFFFKFGLSEEIVKFFLQFIPSVLSVVLVYFICKEMYDDKRVAIISSFLMAVLWEHLFNSMRFHIDILALFTGLLSIYVYWKGFEKKEKIFGIINSKLAISFTVILVVLTYTIRRGYFLFAFFFLFHALTTKKFPELIKKKYNWIALGLGILLFIIAEKSIFISRIQGVSETYFHPENKINLLPLGVFPAYFGSTISIPSILLYLYWIGFILIIINIIFSLGFLKKIERSPARADLFNLFTILITLLFFILIIRTQNVFGEGRWFFPLALGSFICIARSSIFIIDFLKKYNKYLAYVAIFIFMAFGGYYELVQADSIIKNKEGSFEGIRQASLYLKEVSNQEDIIISVAVPQVVYYAERNVIQPDYLAGWKGAGEDLPMEDFFKAVRNNPKAKYLLVSFYQIGHPEWMTKVYGNNGQVAGWEIPFMDTKIDFSSGQQDIKKEKAYDDITFILVDIKQDVFIYGIKRT